MAALWNVSTLILTLVIESVGLVIWNKIRKRAWQSTLLALLLINLVTQGILFAGLVLSPLPYWPTLLGLEMFIFLLEIFGYHIAGLTVNEAFQLSIALNLTSFLIGLSIPF
jgi:hypothetical protein